MPATTPRTVVVRTAPGRPGNGHNGPEKPHVPEPAKLSDRPATFTRRLIALMNGFSVEILERIVRREEVIGLVMEQCRLELDPRTGLWSGAS